MINVFTIRLRTIADAMGAVPDCPPAPWETCPECVAVGKREAALDALASMWAALDADARFRR